MKNDVENKKRVENEDRTLEPSMGNLMNDLSRTLSSISLAVSHIKIASVVKSMEFQINWQVR